MYELVAFSEVCFEFLLSVVVVVYVEINNLEVEN